MFFVPLNVFYAYLKFLIIDTKQQFIYTFTTLEQDLILIWNIKT